MIPRISVTIFAAALPFLPALQPKDPPAPAAPPGHAQPPAPGNGKAEVPKASNPAVIPVPREEDYCKERHERFNARAKQGHEKGDIELIFLGDSITEQWEGPGKEVWDKCYAGRHAVNFGTGGDQTQHVLWRIQNGNVDGLDKPAPKDAKPPRLAVVMIGTNNAYFGDQAPDQIAAGVKAVVVALREKLPRTDVLLLAIFPRGEKPDDLLRIKVRDTNRLIEPAVANMPGVHYLDIGEKLIEKDGTITKDTMPDALHLSAKGYEIEAQALEPRIREFLSEK
jgi:lysophospholipase L1-like esterase